MYKKENHAPSPGYNATVRTLPLLHCFWNVMAHAQKTDFVFRRNGRVHLNRQGRQFSRLLAAEVCASAVVMLDTPSSEVVWRVLAIHSIRQFPLHFPSRASPCAITFQLDSTTETPIASNGRYPPESFTLETVTEMCVETKQFQQMKRPNPKYKFTHKSSASETN
jgi:hypothetical protein